MTLDEWLASYLAPGRKPASVTEEKARAIFSELVAEGRIIRVVGTDGIERFRRATELQALVEE